MSRIQPDGLRKATRWRRLTRAVGLPLIHNQPFNQVNPIHSFCLEEMAHSRHLTSRHVRMLPRWERSRYYLLPTVRSSPVLPLHVTLSQHLSLKCCRSRSNSYATLWQGEEEARSNLQPKVILSLLASLSGARIGNRWGRFMSR